jgi:hypothetical protein
MTRTDAILKNNSLITVSRTIKGNEFGAVEMRSNSTMASAVGSHSLASQTSVATGHPSQSALLSQDYHGSSAMVSSFMGGVPVVQTESGNVTDTAAVELSLDRVCSFSPASNGLYAFIA